MWSNFSQSANEDETINNAFCTNSLFKIGCDELVSKYPKIEASVQNSKMVISIDQSVILLEDENIAKCSFLCFDAPIDAMAISQSGNLIICALTDGNVHGVFIKGIPVFNCCIKSDDIQTGKPTFSGIQEVYRDYYITCTNGSIYRLTNVRESRLDSLLNISLNSSETLPIDETFMENVELERLTSTKSLNEITAFTLIPRPERSYQLVAGTKCFIRFQRSTEDIKIILPEFYEGLKKICNLDNFVIALTNSGHLVEICPETLLIFQAHTHFDYLIDNLIVMENNLEAIELLLLTKPSADGSRSMKIVEFPSFNCTYELAMTKNTWLVNQPKNSVNLYYLSAENLNVKNLPQEIEMKLVSETQPAERMKKLIHKGHLEEAEEFGKQFGLSLQPIYEGKAKRILLEMNTMSENNIDLMQAQFKELIPVLKLIENKDFLAEIRSLEIPNRRLLAMFLNEMLNQLTDEKYEKDIYEIKEQQLRLETLNIIDPYECNMDWQKFVHHPQIIKVCQSMFKTDMLTACLIWKRHSASIVSRLDEKNILQLLNLIPTTTEAFNVIQWLRHFVPSVVQSFPRTMPHIIDWAIKKTRSLQYSQHWPEIGLEFSTKVASIFDDLTFLHSDVGRQHESSVEKLRNLVNALQDLSVLKKSYNLIFTLDNYIKDSIDDTALCILQRVQITNLKSIVNDFFYPIYMEKGQSPVNAIIKYIKFLVANRNSLSSWLERAIACIELLHNEEERLKCGLLVLQSAPVPWSETVAPLLKLRHSTHPIAAEINIEYEIQVIKIMKVKYGWPADSTDSNMKLVFRIVKVGLPEMFQDIKDLTKATPDIQSSANFYCCYELARTGKIDRALKFFNGLDDKQKIDCSEKIMHIFPEILETSSTSKSEQSSHNDLCEFFKCIIPHSNKSDKKRLMEIQNIQILRNKFNLDVSSNQLESREHRVEWMKIGIDFVHQEARNSKNVVKHIWQEICQLTQTLGLDTLVGLLEISRAMKNIHLSCALGYYALELIDCTKSNAELFIDFAVLLLVQQIEIVWEGVSIDPDPLVYPLMYKLLIKCQNLSKVNKLEIFELLRWTRIVNNSYSLTAVQEVYGNHNDWNEVIVKQLTKSESNGHTNELDDVSKNPHKRHSISIFDEALVKPESVPTKPASEITTIVSCVSLGLLLVLLELKPESRAFQRIESFLPEHLQSKGDETNEKFYRLFEHLIKAKQHNTWYILAQYLMEYQKNSETKIMPVNFVSLQVKKMFRHILMQKEPNFVDFLAMLISDIQPRVMLESLFNEVKTDQQKVNLMMLAEMYYERMEDTQKVKAIRESRLKHYYYTELCKQDASLKAKADVDIASTTQLLKEMRNKMLDVKLLHKMSRDFNWDYQQLLVSQVVTVLHLQEMHFEIKVDSFGKEELVIKTTAEQIKELCQPYISEIKNTEMLATKLLHFIPEINYYFYELYVCVIDILTYVKALPKEMELWGNILVFLKHKLVTKRRNRASQMETDFWLKSQAEIGVLPKIAKYRLPFIPIVQQPLKDILDNEVNVDNCESWFPLIKLHTALEGTSSQEDIVRLQDYFCMSAVKNSISEYKLQNDSDTWHLQPINNAFLQSILRLVQHVANLSKVLLILYFVTSHAPDGADQVEASYECYKFAMKHESALMENEKAHETVLKIKRKYPILKTQHLLHVYGLIEDKLLQLVESPRELIYMLYHHALVLQPTKPDINKVCKEIALLHGLDFDMLQSNLLQKWLSFASSTDVSALEDTFYEDVNNSIGVTEDVEVNGEHVMRAHYILSSWDSEKAMQFLVCHIFPMDGSGVHSSKLLQMYECFTKLVNEKNSSYIDVLNQRQYIVIKCVHDLKQLGYNFTVEKFAEYDKITILKKIWQSHASSSFAMEVIANICLGFDICISKIWNGVLKQMVKFNMVKELNALVDTLSCKPMLLHTDGLARAWECVLKMPFKKADHTRSYEQEESLTKTLFRIQSCPVVSKLKPLEIAEDCIRLDRPHMAAVMIAFCTSDMEKNQIKTLLKMRKNQQLKKEIQDLEECGILPSIINFVLRELEL